MAENISPTPPSFVKLDAKQHLFLWTSTIFLMISLVPIVFPKLSIGFKVELYTIVYALGLMVLLPTIVLGLIIEVFKLAFTRVWPDKTKRIQATQWLCIYFLQVFVAFVVSLFGAWYTQGLPVGSFSKPFDPAVWRMQESWLIQPDDFSLRHKMTGDAIRQVVIGGDRERILQQFGPPSEPSKPGEPLVYYLGHVRTGILDDHNNYLIIKFDQDGKVTDYSIKKEDTSS